MTDRRETVVIVVLDGRTCHGFNNKLEYKLQEYNEVEMNLIKFYLRLDW